MYTSYVSMPAIEPSETTCPPPRATRCGSSCGRGAMAQVNAHIRTCNGATDASRAVRGSRNPSPDPVEGARTLRFFK